MKTKAELAAELKKQSPEPDDAPKEPPKPERRLPNQFDISTRIVDLIHKEWPQAKMQDWHLFYQSLSLARGELRRTWRKRKIEQQPI